MSPHRRKTRALRAIVPCLIAALLAATSGCSEQSTTERRTAAEGVAVTTVVAQERTVTSVLTLDGVVVVNPFVRVAAPQDGVLVSMSKGRIGIVSAPGGKPVSVDLPESTEIVSLLVKPGTRVTAGLPIINARYTGFAIQATVPPEQMYRLYDGIKSVKAQVKVGPGPFDTSAIGVPYPPGAITLPSGDVAASSTAGRMRLLPRLVLCDAPPEETETAGPASCEETNTPEPEPVPEGGARKSSSASKETSTFPVVTTTPPDAKAGVVVIVKAAPGLKLIEGTPARVAVVTAEQTGVALPIEAVAGISQRGQIYVVNAGQVELRNVTLGITDGSYVIVAEGLSAGDVVQIPSPSIVGVD